MRVRVVDKHMRPQPMALSLLLFPGPRFPRNSGQLALRHSAQPPQCLSTPGISHPLLVLFPHPVDLPAPTYIAASIL